MNTHPSALLNERRKRIESTIRKPLGWCRDERLRFGHDQPIMRVRGCLLVYCVASMHKGNWIAWKPSGELLAIGSSTWVRSQLHGVKYPRPGWIESVIGRKPSLAASAQEGAR